VRRYYRVILGKRNAYAAACFDGGFIGADFEISMNLTGELPEAWQAFNKKFIPIYLAGHPGKTRIAAGLSCGFLWTVARGIEPADVVLSPDGSGRYRVGEVTGGYSYHEGGFLPHRRPVRWLGGSIDRGAMSDELRNSAGSSGTISDITRYREEIDRLMTSLPITPTLVSTDESVEDPLAFAMESHLEDFLIHNWAQTELGSGYDIYEKGQQFMTDTGPLDILAISKDKKCLLVVELKKGRASDAVVGQTMRYMGYVKELLAEPGQRVQGAIIALDDDKRIRRALAVMPDITFYRYQVAFKLLKS
jgi:restriction system protein